MEEHETGLRIRLESGLAALPGVTLYGSPERRRTPTVLFSIAGLEPVAVYESLGQIGVNARAGSFYAPECAKRLGLGSAGAVRAGIGPYTNESDVDRLLAGVSDLLA
jgi:selenocysteine lyase/cysteine desulfurase